MTGLVIDVGPLLPALLPLLGVLVILVVDLVSPRLRQAPYAVAVLSVALAAAAALPRVLQGAGSSRTSFCAPASATGSPPTGVGPMATQQTCFWEADSLGSALQLAACFAALVCLLLAWPRPNARVAGPAREPLETVLLLTALAGTVVVAASRDVGTWLVALELATLPVIALVALSGARRSVAGSMQLLVTSLVSFSLLALGAALWFAATGSPFLTADAALSGASGSAATSARSAAEAAGSTALIALSVVLVLAGIGFKLSLVPFHAWTPTAYEGSSLPVATFLATVSKIGALAALLVFLRAVAALGTPGLVATAVLAAVSMTLGNLMALRQHDVVLLLAWSTVAQAGWVVLPLVSVSSLGIEASAAYLLTYVAATLVAFTVVALSAHEQGSAARSLTAYEGMWRRNAWRAGALGLALTSLAGLPPGVIGLFGKVVALRPVVAEGWVWLTVVAAANAVLGVAVYLRWLRPIVTSVETTTAAPAAADERAAARAARMPAGRRGLLVVAVAVTAAVLFGVSVQPDLLLGVLR